MKTLRQAFIAIAEADTGAGGMVVLCGNAEPLVYARALTDDDLPRAIFIIVNDPEGTQSGKESPEVQFTVFTGPFNGNDYIEKAEDIRARLKLIMSNTNLKAQGVDAAPLRPRKRDLLPERDGVIGLVLEMEFFNAA